jgi:DNA polymerase
MSSAALPPGRSQAMRSWDELAVMMRGCTRCPELVASRTTVVPGELPAGADVVLIGEAPGAFEDAGGRPFVGRSGQLLDELLAAAGLDRSRIGVVNTLKCRPPKNRKPRRAELANCRPWLHEQLRIADPAVIVALGGTAAEWFVGPAARIATLRALPEPPLHDGRPVIATYHPSAAIRFGPAGEPRAALAADLVHVAALVRRLRP